MRRYLLRITVYCLIAGPASAGEESGVTADSAGWNGIYAGLNFGTGWGRSHWSKPTGALTSPGMSDFPARGEGTAVLGGLTLGYNRQIGDRWVVGVEGELDALSLTSDANCGNAAGGIGWVCRTKTDAASTLSARLGRNLGSRLLFLKGGLAYARENVSIFSFNPHGYDSPNPSIRVTRDRLGGAFGAGIEQVVDDDWSMKLELDHYRFGSRSFAGTDPQAKLAYGASEGGTISAVKFGLNYHFGSTPAASAPSLQFADDISGEFGARAGWASGDYRYDLYDENTNSRMNSRLTWPGTGLTTEVFARADHTSGAFLKGVVGGIFLPDGKEMHDEDFIPPPGSYSDTVSVRKDSGSIYATIDAGYAVQGETWRLGPFVGYSYFEENQRAYGCTQMANNSDICTRPGEAAAVAADQLILSRKEMWNALRLGVAGDIMVTDRIKLTAETAWLPMVSTKGSTDNHWLRPDINPLKDNATGDGWQTEASLSYLLTDQLSIGIGARSWRMSARGWTQFPDSLPSPVRLSMDRTMVFGQIAYAFGNTKRHLEDD